MADLKQEVINLLKGEAVSKLSTFGLSGFSVTAAELKAVGKAVEDGKIKVTTFSGDGPGAWYDSGPNEFGFRWDDLGALTRKALVVHEATHAALDIENASEIKVLDSEGIAYVHQCQFALPHATGNDRLLGSTPSGDKVFAAAWSIAKTLSEGKTPTEKQIEALREGVRVHPNYLHDHNDKAKFNGI